jgi:hypothetical protein
VPEKLIPDVVTVPAPLNRLRRLKIESRRRPAGIVKDAEAIVAVEYERLQRYPWWRSA